MFSLLAEKKIVEGSQGFILQEAEEEEDEQDMLKRKATHISRQTMHRPRFSFNSRRKGISERREILRQRLQAMGYSDEAEEMQNGKRTEHPYWHSLSKPLPPGWGT